MEDTPVENVNARADGEKISRLFDVVDKRTAFELKNAEIDLHLLLEGGNGRAIFIPYMES